MKIVTIERTKTRRTTVKSKVALPSYHKHDLMPDDYESVIYTRVGEGRIGTDIHVTKYPEWYGMPTIASFQIEIERHATPYFANDEHIAGVGASSREEFLAAAREMHALLTQVIAEAESD